MLVPGACAEGQQPRFVVTALEQTYRSDAPMRFEWFLSNDTQHPLVVLAAMETPGRRDFDPITLMVERIGSASPAARSVIRLAGKRSAARPDFREIRPGERVAEGFDLRMFAGFSGVRLDPGTYRLTAIYDLGETGIVAGLGPPLAFTGRLAAPPLTIRIAAGS